MANPVYLKSVTVDKKWDLLLNRFYACMIWPDWYDVMIMTYDNLISYLTIFNRFFGINIMKKDYHGFIIKTLSINVIINQTLLLSIKCYYQSNATINQMLILNKCCYQSNVTVNKILLSIKWYYQSNVTINQMLLSIKFYYRSNVTINQMVLSIKCYYQLNVTINQILQSIKCYYSTLYPEQNF